MPQYRRLFDLYRRNNVLINFHSCGEVSSVIPVLLDLGADILNPVQATANDLDHMRAMTAGRMALQGGVGTQTILAGPPAKIVAEVRRRMWQLGRDGGYFASPDQGMPFPEAHIAAFNNAVGQYGRYPLSEMP